MTTERMSDDDLIQRLRLCGVEAGVIDYARDAIASGETRETTIQRLRALGLCPQGFFDECDWHDVETPGDGPRAATPHPPPPIRPPQRASRGAGYWLRYLGFWVAFAAFLALCKTSAGFALALSLWVAAVALAMVAVGLWIALKGVTTAWWRGGRLASLVMAAALTTVIGCLWPSLGIWDNPTGRWLFGKDIEASAAPSPVTPEARDAILAKARAAIAKGAPRDKVIERMRKFGLDPSGL